MRFRLCRRSTRINIVLNGSDGGKNQVLGGLDRENIPGQSMNHGFRLGKPALYQQANQVCLSRSRRICGKKDAPEMKCTEIPSKNNQTGGQGSRKKQTDGAPKPGPEKS